MNYNKMKKSELVKMLELRDQPVYVSDPTEVVDYLKPYTKKKQEYVIALYVNTKLKVEMMKVITIGGISSSTADVRDVFASAVEGQMFGVILAHNHPSGDATPSANDIEFTKNMWKAGEILSIPVLDHVVFSENGFKSIKDTDEWKEFMDEQTKICKENMMTKGKEIKKQNKRIKAGCKNSKP